MVVRCMECNKITAHKRCLRRGLCVRCYRQPDIRECHEPLPRGTNGVTASFRHWSMLDTGRLIAMFRDGKSDKQIAAALGRTAQSVKSKRRTLRDHGRRLKVSPLMRGRHQTANHREGL